MKRFFYMLVQVVWGAPQTLVGLCVFLAHARCPHFLFHGAVVTVWQRRSGLSLGLFVFLNGLGSDAGSSSGSDAPSGPASTANRRLLVHEYGHTVQSLILGPLYLIVVGIPSAIWANVPALARRRHRLRTSYYAFAPERSANWLGEHVLKEPSMGLAVID